MRSGLTSWLVHSIEACTQSTFGWKRKKVTSQSVKPKVEVISSRSPSVDELDEFLARAIDECH